MVKKFTVIGAAIGAAGCFALQTALIVMAYLAEPAGPGLLELAFQFVLVCIISATGAAVGSVAGLIVGIAVSIFSRNKESQSKSVGEPSMLLPIFSQTTERCVCATA